MFFGIVVSDQRLFPYHAILVQDNGQKLSSCCQGLIDFDVRISIRRLKTDSKHFRNMRNFAAPAISYHAIFRPILWAIAQAFGQESIDIRLVTIHQNIYHQSLGKSEHGLPSMRGKRWFRVVLSDFRLFPHGSGLVASHIPTQPLLKH